MQVLDDTDLLALYDRWDYVPGAPDTGIGTDMGVEGERRAMWRARAAYVEAHRALNVAILRRHEGRLARALEVREVRGWLDALAKVLGLVEEARRGRLRWEIRRGLLVEPYPVLLDDRGMCRGSLSNRAAMWWFSTANLLSDTYPTEAEARAALIATLRADGWEVPEDEARPAGKWKVRWSRDRNGSHDNALKATNDAGSCVGVVDCQDGSWCWFVDRYPHHCGSRVASIAGLVARLRSEGYDTTEAEARDALISSHRADEWEVPE